MKKVVLKLDLQEAGDKRRALKTVATLSGIDEISIDTAAKKLTLIGTTVDPVNVVSKLRKRSWPAEIISVGPDKEPERKEEPKKDETTNKVDEAPKKEEANKKNEPVVSMTRAYSLYYPMNSSYYAHPCSIEENPNACAIL